MRADTQARRSRGAPFARLKISSPKTLRARSSAALRYAPSCFRLMKFSIARMDSGMVGNKAEANKNASHFETPTSSHSKSFGQRWELDPLPVHLC